MKLKLARVGVGLVALAIVLLLPQASFAIPITGTFNITGGVTVFIDPVLGTVIDFIPTGTGSGDVTVLELPDSPTESFAGLGNTTANIMDLNETDHPAGTPLGASGVGFITFDADPNIRLDVTMLVPGEFTAAQCGTLPASAGQTCTPAAPLGGSSLFELINTSAGSSIAGFEVVGTATNLMTGEISFFTGSFSATFNDIPYQTLLNNILTGTPVTTGYDAEFHVVIPEPSTINLMLGAVFVAASFLGGRKLRRRA
jgi:hypothetical protein